MNRNKALITSILAISLSAQVHAGTFLFAEANANPNLIVHPIGYNGTGGTLPIEVCIAADSESQSDLEIPVQNAVATWTAMEPTKSNVTRFDQELDPNQFDVESVLLHELGHCIGLAHPNLGNESGFPIEEREKWDFAKTLKGPNEEYDLDFGGDEVRGSRDDVRGDDINLNWFRIDQNDPFLYETEIDLGTYSNDVNDLPSDTQHEWVEIASFEVSQERGEGSGEAVMIQGTVNQETQRHIHNQDATTLRIGMAGLDEDQGTDDDYNVQLNYGGVSDSENCDITIRMTGESFGNCTVEGGSTFGSGSNHVTFTKGTITIGSTDNFNWHFNSTATGNVVFQDRFED